MITFGLTGGIASGKSTVTKTFLANNIPMVDADLVARDVVKPGTYGLIRIVETFGKEYLNEDGTLHRTKLGALVFSDKNALALIDELMYPLIRSESDRQIKQYHNEGHYIVGYDGALICEMGNAKNFKPLIVVHCPQDVQIQRLMTRNSLTAEEAMLRISSQMPVDEKIKLADFTIDTSGTIEESVKQTEEVIHKIRAIMYKQKLDSGEITYQQVPHPWRHKEFDFPDE